MAKAEHKLGAEITGYYNRGREAARLEGGKNQRKRKLEQPDSVRTVARTVISFCL